MSQVTENQKKLARAKSARAPDGMALLETATDNQTQQFLRTQSTRVAAQIAMLEELETQQRKMSRSKTTRFLAGRVSWFVPM